MTVKRLEKIGISPALAISGKAKQMVRDGIDVIDFSLGEPDFPTPTPIKEAAKKAIDDNFTRYTHAQGIPELRQAVVEKLGRDNGLSVSTDEVIISSGAKHSLSTACMALIDPGDEAIIPAPYWFSYPPMVYLAGGCPRILRTREEDHFLLTPEAFEAAITPRTRVLFLNNPSNPTGMTYPRKHLEALAEIAARHDVRVIADEIYEKLLFSGEFVCFASLGEKARRITVTINGFSKAYAMTGWRLGYAAGPKDIIADMTRIQSQTTSSICSISQKAGIGALTADQSVVDEMVDVFRGRRRLIVDRLQKIPGVDCLLPDGAFYAFPNVSTLYDRLPDLTERSEGSIHLAEYLLDSAHIAVVPGIAFGAEENIRLSYATSTEKIDEGLTRFQNALACL